MRVVDQTIRSTSIRVSSSTRDRLAHLARTERLSVTAYLDKIARRLEREALYAQFRQAVRNEPITKEWQEEFDQWSATDLDGWEDDDWPEFN
ncbi:MAG: hypothetical protein LBR27_01660 [Bifidobacteriaceae bacterium]|jgi:predicted transcriptional regulator|nr:hypothetical protein [Bifidobacteriaceae bacterium]